MAFINDNVDTYLNLKPEAATEASTGTASWVYALVVAGVVAVAAVVVVLLRRGRGKAVEE